MNPPCLIYRGCSRLRRFAAVLVAATSIGFSSSAPALVLDVVIDTSAISGNALLDFLLIDNDGVANNSVTIANFLSPGATLNGDVSPPGDTTGGPLPVDVVVGDDFFINDHMESLVLGSEISFRLTITEERFGVGGIDTFALTLRDGTSTAFPTTDPLGFDAILTVDIGGPGATTLAVYDPAGTAPNASWTVTEVPEPGILGLLGAALLLIGAVRARATPHT